jgi:riboflavin kinase / FMN adenylyltransferase
MKIFQLESIERLDRDTALALGFFDGIHLGHATLINVTVGEARKRGIVSAISTFRRHPFEILHKNLCFPYINTLEEKHSLAQAVGVDYFIDMDFSAEFSRLSPQEFLQNVVRDKLRARVLVVGNDYHFGKDAAGDVELLKKIAEPEGIKVIVVDDVMVNNEKISSTGIREMIIGGYVDIASHHLGRWYSLDGIVKSGEKRGRILGIPTANLDLPHNKIMPRPGVYCIFAAVSGKVYPGAAHVGNRPTFQEEKYNVEVHIFDFNENLYGETIRVFFLKHLRDTVSFESTDAMMSQIAKDLEDCQDYFGKIKKEDIEQYIPKVFLCNSCP